VGVCDKKHAHKSPLFSFFSAVSIIVFPSLCRFKCFSRDTGKARRPAAYITSTFLTLPSQTSLPGVHKRTHGQGRTWLVRNVELSCNSILRIASCCGAIRLEYANRQIHWSKCRDSNHGPPEYVTGMQNTLAGHLFLKWRVLL